MNEWQPERERIGTDALIDNNRKKNQEATHREAYGYEPAQAAPGHYIDEMREYANTTVTREDSGVLRCATFGAFAYACQIIGAGEKLPDTKIYPALRYVGYNHRYHNMKNDNPDALWDIGELTRRCMISGDPGIVPFVSSSHGLFSDVRSVQYRIGSPAIAVAQKDAAMAGVKVSELNLFNALEGLTILVENENEYFLLRENLFIDESLNKFSFIKKHLTAKRGVLAKFLGV